MQFGLMVFPGSILFYFIVKKLKKVGNVGIILVLLILSAPCFWLQMFFFTKIVKEKTNLNGSEMYFYESTVGVAFVFEGLNFAFFSVAHWIFAILMWFSAQKLS